MTAVGIGIVGIILLFLLIFLGMPVGFSMAMVGFFGFMSLGSLPGALHVITSEPFENASSYTWSVIALFILMGELATAAGITERFYQATHKWIGHWPGGLAMSTIAGCGGFAAISGSSLATALTMGSVSWKEMMRYKYDPKIASGCIAAGGTLGILIPPSSVMIVFGALTETSIIKLFMAGLVPGLLLTGLFMLTVYIWAKVNPSLCSPAPSFPLREKLAALLGVFDLTLIIIVILGGLYAGIFTPNEAAGVGTGGVLLIGLIRRQFTWKSFTDALVKTVRTTGLVFAMIIGAQIFSRFVALTDIPLMLSTFVTSLSVPPLVIVLGIILMYFVLGCFLDSMATTLLTLPIIAPILSALGVDLIWFGIIFVTVVELSYITPPRWYKRLGSFRRVGYTHANGFPRNISLYYSVILYDWFVNGFPRNCPVFAINFPLIIFSQVFETDISA